MQEKQAPRGRGCCKKLHKAAKSDKKYFFVESEKNERAVLASRRFFWYNHKKEPSRWGGAAFVF